MKKVLTITLLVLLAVGLFVSCNADAIETAFGSDCYIYEASSGVVEVIVKDTQSKWNYIHGTLQSDKYIAELNFELAESGNTLSGKCDNPSTEVSFSLSSKMLDTHHGSLLEMSPATIITPLNLQEDPKILICECNGKEYTIIFQSIIVDPGQIHFGPVPL